MKKLVTFFGGTCVFLQLIAPASGQTLGEALNATNLTWVTSGNAVWFTQTTNTHDGVAAAQTGALITNQTSILETTLVGTGTLTFWWQVEHQGRHRLDFKMNGVSVTSIYGASWRQQTIYVGPGTNVIQWVFADSYAFGYVFDAGQVDQVSFVPGTTAPFITSQPISRAQAPHLDTTFTVSASGTPPLSYQWLLNGTNIPGAQSTSWTVTNMSALKAGNYSVIVSNVAGTTPSSNAVLSLSRLAVWGGANDLPHGLTNILAIAVGDNHSLALRADHTLVGWGADSFGQAGPPADLTNAVAIAGGQFHSLALRSDGTVAAWGRNDYNQTNVPPDATNVVAIAAGGNHSVALQADGTVTVWGDNNQGEHDVPANLSNVVAIATGLAHVIALKADGQLTAWGWNQYGVKTIPNGLTNVVAIAAGSVHNVALTASGSVIGWGDNSSNQTNVPPGLTNVIAIAAGSRNGLALRADGTVVGWGYSPMATVPAGLANVTAIAAGGLYHSLAIVGDNPPERRASFVDPAFSSDGFKVSLPSRCGRVYALEYRSSLTADSWTALSLLAGNGGILMLADPATNQTQRFYRVREW